MTLGMKTKYLIPNIALITAGMMIASIVSYIVINNTLTQTFVEKMEDRANLSVNLMNLWIADKESDIRGLSQRRLYLTVVKDSYMGRNARKSANLELAKLLQSYPFYENICVSDKQGNLVASSDTSIIGKINLSEYNFFKKNLCRQECCIKTCYKPGKPKTYFYNFITYYREK